jgi:hypothetical protein
LCQHESPYLQWFFACPWARVEKLAGLKAPQAAISTAP